MASSGLSRIAVAVFGDCLVQLALLRQDVAEVDVGDGVVGLEPDRRAEFGDGLVELALARQGDAEVAVVRSAVGLESDRLTPRGHGGFERFVGFSRQPFGLERLAEASKVPGIARPQPLEIAEHGDSLAGLASLLQSVGQLVGGLRADRSRGGVEPDGLVAARERLQHRRQRVVDPDITRIPLLGRRSTDSARVESPASFRPVPSKCRPIAPTSSDCAAFARVRREVNRAALSD